MNLPRLVRPVVMLLIAVALIDEPVARSQGHKTPPRTSTNKPAAVSLVGQYSIVGTNPDGGAYKGNLEVIARGDVYQFRWAAGSQSDGIGVRNGSVIAVASDAIAVTILTLAESQKTGLHSVQISIAWVAPHARMKVPNAKNIQSNGSASRIR